VIRLPFVLVSLFVAGSALAQGDAKRGEYLAKVAGCVGCHTEEKEGAAPYAGGRALKTPFGTSTARTSRPTRKPVSATGPRPISSAPCGKATARTARTSSRPSLIRRLPRSKTATYATCGVPAHAAAEREAQQEHDLWFFFGWRWVVTIWKWLYFTPGAFADMPGVPAAVNSGAYLVQRWAIAASATRRATSRGPKSSRYLAGGKGPDGKSVSNLTPTNLKKQSDKEIKDFLVTGLTARATCQAEAMGEVIKNHQPARAATRRADRLPAYAPAAAEREEELAQLYCECASRPCLAADAVEGPGEDHRCATMMASSSGSL